MSTSEIMRDEAKGSSRVPVSTQNKLSLKRSELEKELKAVNEAIELFTTHPEIADALDLLSQIRFNY